MKSRYFKYYYYSNHMQSSILSNDNKIKDNTIVSPVDNDGYSTDTELIDTNELLGEALILDLNKPILLKRSKFYMDIRMSPEYQQMIKFQQSCQNTNNKIVFSLVHQWIDNFKDEVDNVCAYPEFSIEEHMSMEDLVECKIFRLVLKQNRVAARKIKLNMDLALKNKYMPLPNRAMKRKQRFQQMLEEERNKQ